MEPKPLQKSTTQSIYRTIGVAIQDNGELISKLLFIFTMAALLDRAFGFIYTPTPAPYYPYFNESAPTTSVFFSGNGTDYRLDLYGVVTSFTEQFNNMANLLDSGTCGANGNVTLIPADFTLVKQWGGGLMELWRGLDQEIQNATEQCVITLVQNTYNAWNRQMDIALIVIFSIVFGIPAVTAAIICAICCCPRIFSGIRDIIQNSIPEARHHHPAAAPAQLEAGNAQPMVVLQPQQPVDERSDTNARPAQPR